MSAAAYEHRLDNAMAQVCDAASAWCWDPTPKSEAALRDAVAEWRTSVGLWKLAAAAPPECEPDEWLREGKR